MNYIGINTCDTANGPGVRVSLFVSGCTLHCKGCFNQESWDFEAGKLFTDETLAAILKALDNEYIDGLSILGGDPLEERNQETVYEIIKAVRAKFKKSKTIWLWTGRKYDKIIQQPIAKRIIEELDVLVDGPYIEHLRINDKAYYGSSNQRVITLRNKK